MIHAYASGFASSNKCAAASVLLTCEDYKHEQTVDLQDMNMRRAELLATLLALDSVKDRDIPTIIHTDSQNVYSVLERDGDEWMNDPNVDRELVDELRKTFLSFHQADVTLDKDCEEINLVSDRCRQRYKDQIGHS